MAEVPGGIRVTTANLLKTLNDKAEIDHLLMFLTQLNNALSKGTSPEVSYTRAAWVPDSDHEPNIAQADTSKLPLKYGLRTHDQKSDNGNEDFLFMTDIASLLTNDQAFSVRRWLEKNSPDIQEVKNIISNVRDGELLDYARVEKNKPFILPDGTESKTTQDGYSELAFDPNSGLNLLNEAKAYDRLVKVAQILLEAALVWQANHPQLTTLPISSIKPIIDRVLSRKPLETWETVRVFAEALSKFHS